MVSNRSTIDELESFLKKALIPHGISNIEVEPVGTTEVGDGFLGDITFLKVKGIKDDSPTELELVVKTGKKSQAVRDGAPIHGAFRNEANLYCKILPEFQKFEKDRGVKDYFNSVPKCFGASIGDDDEYIAFQNLKAIGYDLNDKRKTMTRKYTEAVLAQYAHWHAISAAMQDQEPEKFKTLVKETDNIWIKFGEDAEKMYDSIITTVLNVCDDTDKNILTKFESLRKDIKENVCQEEFSRRFQVIVHGDCWNNNFLFKEEVSLIIILEKYYEIFANHLRTLRSDPDKVYSKKTFLKDWKDLAHYGTLLGMVTTQICLTDKSNTTDLTTALENGMTVADNFNKEVSYKDQFKERCKAIVEYTVQNGLIPD